MFQDTGSACAGAPWIHLGCLGILLQKLRLHPGEAGPILDAAVAAGRASIRLEPRRLHGPQQPRPRPERLRGSLTQRSTNSARRSASSPTTPWPNFNLGNTLHRQKKLDLAIAEYRAAIRLKPDDAAAHNKLGMAAQSPGEAQPGDRRIPQRRSGSSPDDFQGHGNLGNALRSQGKLDLAIPEYRAAIRLAPGNANAHNWLGNALSQQGNARRGCRRIQQGDPASARRRLPPHQPRRRSASPGQVRRGDRRIPRGDPARPPVRPRSQQPRHRPAPPGGSLDEAIAGIPRGDPARPPLRPRSTTTSATL